jgi:hypothetical protein
MWFRPPAGVWAGPRSGTMADVSSTDSSPLADEEGSKRPPTKVPGVWTQMPLAARIAVVVLLLVAVGGIAAISRTSLQSSSDLAGGTVVLLSPTDGSNILQQDTIGITLVSGYSTTLRVAGTTLPASQVRRVSYASQVAYSFEPGPGKVFTRWPEGKSCVDATYWKTADGPGASSVEHWCFTVL